MTPPKNLGDRHARVGPGLEVGACGARGDRIRFAVRRGDISCPRCKELRANSEATAKQQAKMRKSAKAATAMRLAGIPSTPDDRGW